MAVVTIAQMMAVLSADNTALEARLAQAEKRIEDNVKVTQAAFDKNDKANAASSKKQEQTEEQKNANLRKAEENRAKYEYDTNQKSAADYKKFLDQRLQAYEAHTSKWSVIANQAASVQRKLDKETADAKVAIEKQTDERLFTLKAAQLELISRAEQEQASESEKRASILASVQVKRNLDIAGAIAAGGNAEQLLRDKKMSEAMHVVTNPNLYSTSEQVAASEKIIGLTRQEVTAEEKAANEKAAIQKRIADLKVTIAKEADDRIEASNLERSKRIESEYRAMLAQQEADYNAYFGARAAAEKAYDDAAEARNANLLAAQTSTYKAALAEQDAAAAKSKKTRGKLLDLGGWGAAGITAGEVASGALAANFDQKTQQVASNSLMSPDELAAMRKQIISTARETGQSFDDLSDAMLHIASEGYKGADGLNVLEVAAKRATSTGAKVSDVANALANELKGFNMQGSKAETVMDTLAIAAGRGNSTMEQWADGTRSAVAITAAYGGNLKDVEALLSALTRHNFTPEVASNQVTNLAKEIVTPVSTARKEIELLEPLARKLGFSLKYDFSQAGFDAKGYFGILRDIKELTGGDADVTSALFGNSKRGGVAGLVAMTTAAKDYADALRAIEHPGPGPTQTDFDKSLKNFKTQYDLLKTNFEADFLPIGEKSIGLFKNMMPILKDVANLVLNIMETFEKLPKPIQEVITVLGGLKIINSFTGLFTALSLPVDAKATLGFLGKLKDLLVAPGSGIKAAFVEATTAETGFGFSLAGLAASGGAIALVAGALVGMGILVKRTADAFNDAAEAEQQAADNADSLLEKQQKLAKTGERGALESKIPGQQEAIDALQAKIDDAKTKLNQNAFEKSKSLPESHGSDNYLNGIIASTEKQIDTESRALLVERERLEVLNKQAEAAKKLTDNVKESGTAFSKSQVDIAKQIIAIGEARGASQKQILSAIETGLVESNMKNMKDGDRDSAGVFQQRPSQGWGTYGQVTNVTTAANSFYDKLLSLKDQDERTPGSNAQAVQRSAFPLRYDQREGDAKALMNQAGYNVNTNGVPDMPPTVAGKLTAAMVAKIKEIAKENSDAAKKAVKEAKDLQDKYEEHIRSLQQIVALNKEVGDFDDPNKERNKVKFDISPEGELKDLNNKKKASLLAKADLADAMEMRNKVAQVIRDATDKVNDESLPTNIKKALDMAGISAREWANLGLAAKKGADGFTEAQERILKASYHLGIVEAAREASKAIQDLAIKQKLLLPENAALSKAVDASGGIDKWKELGVNPMFVGPRRTDGRSDAQANLISEAQTGIDTANEKWFRDQATDLKQRWENFLYDLDKKRRLKDRPQDMGDLAGQDALDQFNDTNKDKITQILASGSLRDKAGLAQTQLDVFNQSKQVYDTQVQNDQSAKEEELNTQTQQLTESLADLNRIYKTEGDRAVAEWVASNKDLITQLGTDSDAVVHHEEAIKELTNSEKAYNEALERRNELTGGLASATMAGLNAAFNPSASERGGLQSQLLSQQQQLLQYQVAEQEFKSKYPGDANDPYTTVIANLNKQIDATNQKLHDMGNNLTSVFKRLFGTIAQDFEQTLAKMAQDYLQSQLQQYLSRQLGGASSLTGGDPIGGILNVVAGIFGASNIVSGGGNATTVGNAFGADPTSFLPGGGSDMAPQAQAVHMATGGVVPSIPNLPYGDNVPALLTPGEEVIPVSAAKNMQGHTTIINNSSFTQNVSTPDVRGVRDSMQTMKQDAGRVFAGNGRRR